MTRTIQIFLSSLMISTIAMSTAVRADDHSHEGEEMHEQASGSKAIAARQNIMKGNGKAMKALSAMAKGDTEFDAVAANEYLASIHQTAQELPMLFPEDSQTGAGHEHSDASEHVTEAAHAIWENSEEFEAALDQYIADTGEAVAADPQTPEELGAAMAMFAGNCKTCHADFRVKK